MLQKWHEFRTGASVLLLMVAIGKLALAK